MRSFLLLSLLALSVSLHAQDTLIVTSYLPPFVRVGQLYDITYAVQGNVRDYKEPHALPGFEVLQGPSTSRTMNSVNGTTTEVTYYTYRMRINAAGEIEAPRFKAQVDSTWHTSASTRTTALEEDAPTPTPTAMSEALAVCVDPDGVLSAYVYKDGAYLGERKDGDVHLVRYLTDKEAAELERYLRKLAAKE